MRGKDFEDKKKEAFERYEEEMKASDQAARTYITKIEQKAEENKEKQQEAKEALEHRYKKEERVSAIFFIYFYCFLFGKLIQEIYESILLERAIQSLNN